MRIRANLKTWLAISVFLLAIGCPTVAGQTIYVDINASGANNGSSWADAYNHLQDALAAAAEGDQIWVAEGTYKPDQGNAVKPGDRDATFKLKSGVAIYGGFPSGGGEWQDSNPDAYKTILSGDLNGNDIEVASAADLPDEPSRADNSYHVVTGSETDPTAVLDGFIITAGTGAGGGMYNSYGSPTVSNCTFTRNSACCGGGMHNRYSSPTLTDCTFTENYIKNRGSGIFNFESTPALTNCTFSGNSTRNLGGGIFNSYSNPTLTNCTFSGNASQKSGGGMYNCYSTPALTNCTFTGNSASYGAGIYCHNECKPVLTNCTFAGNSARETGGGIWNGPTSKAKLTNCILWGNSDRDGVDESAQLHGSGVALDHCCIQDWTGGSGETGNMNVDPMFVRNPDDGGDGWGDDPQTADMDEGANDDYGDLHLLPDSPCIDAGENTAVPPAVTVDIDGDPRFIDGNTDGIATVDMGAVEHQR